jgi:hypothetical protein
MVDPGPEEMPVYSNSSTRIEVTFRIAARVLIIPGVRRVRRDADGNSRVTLERIIRPTYFVEFADTQAVIPAKDAEDPVLRVEGVLANRSNTYITPLIQAQLRNLTTRRIVEKVTLGHGLAFVMSSTNRRFSGAFTSALEPGHYEITVEVDLGDSSPPRRTQLALELTEPIVGRSQGPQGVVSLDNSKATVRLRPGERSAGRVQVTNNLGETVRVTPYLGSSSFAEWITLYSKVRGSGARAYSDGSCHDPRACGRGAGFGGSASVVCANNDQRRDLPRRRSAPVRGDSPRLASAVGPPLPHAKWRGHTLASRVGDFCFDRSRLL